MARRRNSKSTTWLMALKILLVAVGVFCRLLQVMW